jgi:hypothetical protein
VNQVERAIEQIIEALKPLTDAGVLVRTVADASNAIGRIETNGVVVVSYSGDTDFEGMNTMGGFNNRYMSQFAISGRLRNVRSEQGFYATRSLVYRLLVGLRLDTYTGPLRVLNFQPEGQVQGRTETYWGFLCVVGAPGLQVADNEIGIGGEPIVPGEIAALLAEVIFEDTEVLPEIFDFGG